VTWQIKTNKRSALTVTAKRLNTDFNR